MNTTERTIENIEATMAMEGMPLTNDYKEILRDCIEGRLSFDKAVDDIVNRHKK